MNEQSRRNFLELVGLGGVVFASGLLAGLPACARSSSPSPGAGAGAHEDFFFLQLSDTHWGYHGAFNPDADHTLPRTVAAIAALPQKPAFVVFTGDLTQTTEDAVERRRRMAEMKSIVAGIGVPSVRFLAGEHDAALDRGEAYREHFGDLHYTFDHGGIHFVALDNVSDPEAALGAAQLAWLRADLAATPPATPVVVFAHRPLFELDAGWDWTTKDGAEAITLLGARENVTVFYGHIHQEHHRTTGRIAHHAARSLIFPLPAPGSAPKRAPVAWDAASPTHGIGYRRVAPEGGSRYALAEVEAGPAVVPGASSAAPGAGW
jgi:hypothetical protein